jgi:hypothetical protein
MKKFCNLTQEQAIARFNSIFAGTISYNLHINLHKGKNYDGHLEMEFNAKNPDSIFLEYLGNNFRYEHINQQQVPLQDDSHEWGIHSNIDIDGTQYIYTQNVPHYFSKICPVFDQPDLKARWRLTVEAPADWIIISNEPKTQLTETINLQKIQNELSGDSNGERKFWEFGQTQPLPSYLYTIIGGPFYEMPCPPEICHNGVTSSIFCRKSLAPYATAQQTKIFPFLFDAIARYEL